MIHKLTAGEL